MGAYFDGDYAAGLIRWNRACTCAFPPLCRWVCGSFFFPLFFLPSASVTRKESREPAESSRAPPLQRLNLRRQRLSPQTGYTHKYFALCSFARRDYFVWIKKDVRTPPARMHGETFSREDAFVREKSRENARRTKI